MWLLRGCFEQLPEEIKDRARLDHQVRAGQQHRLPQMRQAACGTVKFVEQRSPPSEPHGGDFDRGRQARNFVPRRAGIAGDKRIIGRSKKSRTLSGEIESVVRHNLHSGRAL